MNIFDILNDRQREAVLHTEGPVLILAGAGSGKTRVLTHRIAYLIEEKNVDPWNIMAITFTNKAAQEMRERVDKIVGMGSEGVWVSTFHSSCVRILRRYIDRIGFGNHFSIYDGDDQKTVIRDVCRRLNIDTKVYRERSLLAKISAAKDEMISPEEYRVAAQSDGGGSRQVASRVYAAYQEQLRQNNALDFDDLLVKTVELFEKCPDVLEYYQNRFRYLMVDEYQDTNTAQFAFVSALAKKYRNLCVVGDDDQSIYKFRGANIQNILGFERVFPDAKVIRLEQNYRSTQTILDAANGVISHNAERKEKNLWTENEKGEKIRLRQFQNGFEEAEFIAGDIAKKTRGAGGYRDFAVLYRTNAQSRLFEEKFLMANIPYKIVGGINFYSRKEIKDILAYLKTIDNATDDVAAERIINVPKRGIGASSLAKISLYAQDEGIRFYEALRRCGEVPGLGRAAAKIRSFVEFIQKYRSQADYLTVSELMEKVIDETGYVSELEAEDTDEARARIENIGELISKAVSYEKTAQNPDLGGFLEEVALIADIDAVRESDDQVLLMTLHSAKGLEFPHVYMAGMEDGIFPGYLSIAGDDPGELEEERRLCYVGITRAKKSLTLTAARQRLIRGETQRNRLSRFAREIPRELVELEYEETETAKAGKTAALGAFGSVFAKAGKPDRTIFQADAFRPRQFTVQKAGHLDYAAGDRVRHVKFGTGTVLSIVDGGKDYEVTVDFDQVGKKKMFASFARLARIGE